MSEPKIKIEALYKIFGKNPKEGMKHVKNGVDKVELLEKYNHVLGLKDINLDIHEKSIQRYVDGHQIMANLSLKVAAQWLFK